MQNNMQIDSILKMPSVLRPLSWSQTREAGAGLAGLLGQGVNPAGWRAGGGRAVPEAVLGRSLGGARDAPSRPAQGLDLSLSPPGAAAAPVVAPRFQKGPSDSSLGQSGAESWSPAQLPLVPERDPSSPELRATFGGSGTVAAAGSWTPGHAPCASAQRARRSLSLRVHAGGPRARLCGRDAPRTYHEAGSGEDRPGVHRALSARGRLLLPGQLPGRGGGRLCPGASQAAALQRGPAGRPAGRAPSRRLQAAPAGRPDHVDRGQRGRLRGHQLPLVPHRQAGPVLREPAGQILRQGKVQGRTRAGARPLLQPAGTGDVRSPLSVAFAGLQANFSF